jgi:hypothetical protein
MSLERANPIHQFSAQPFDNNNKHETPNETTKTNKQQQQQQQQWCSIKQ